MEDTTIIIPTLNEGENISLLIKQLKSLYPNINIIVCDDGSKDGTREAVREFEKKNMGIRLLDRENANTHGLTASVLEGIRNVNTEYIVVMDGDFQHPPEKVKDIVYLLKNHDVVVAWREKVERWEFHRFLISKIAELLGKIRLLVANKHSCKDILSGFFGMKTKVAKEIMERNFERFEGRGYKVLFDYLKLFPKEVKIGEVPYTSRSRGGGSSKLGITHILAYIRSLFIL